jgi:hypothetical protein
MNKPQTDLLWMLRQSVDAFSWTGISWFVALLLGVWGVVIGIGAFVAAYVCLGISLLLCAVKWGHSTNIHTPHRRVLAFVVGILLLTGIGIGMAVWTHGRSIAAKLESEKLAPISKIPELAKQAARIPDLEKQLEDLPKLRETINTLRADNNAANAIAAKREQIIEGLAQTVISQNKVLSADVMGSGYASVMPQLRSEGASRVYGLVVFSYAKSSLYEFHFDVVEAIYPNDSDVTAIAKINATAHCMVGTLYPQSATRTNCTFSVPESGGKYFVTLYDRRGKLLMEQYVFSKDTSGNVSFSFKFFNPVGIEMHRTDLMPQ